MKTLIKVGIPLLVLMGVAATSYQPVAGWWRLRNRPSWREAAVVRGDIVSVVNSTGTVKPIKSVQVGSFVSGPILPESPLVEFNQEVKQGDVLAIIDPRIYEADVDRDTAAVQAAEASVVAAAASVEAAKSAVVAAQASLKTRQAEVERSKAQHKQAENNERRAKTLSAQNKDFISQAEMDQFTYNRMQLGEAVNVTKATVDQAQAAILQANAGVAEAEAALTRAKASVAQAEANKTRSVLNKDYTIITAPVDGIVIDRKIEPGQTLAAAFQTPELFVLAPKMREEMHVYASVDEADIGLIREAKRQGLPVEFTVDSYPDDLFKGTIKEVRFNSTTTQNVVTYPVIVSARNPDLKLLPGMTASISFRIDEKKNVLKIPNESLRFYPLEQHVRPEDRKILDGADPASGGDEDGTGTRSASEKAEAALQRNRRHVWVADGEFVKPVEVVIGISDSKFTEVVSGDVQSGSKLVTGIEQKSRQL